MLEEVQKTITIIVQSLFDIEAKVEVDIPEEQFGDVTTNVAMVLAKTLNSNPREIAESIVVELKKSGKYNEYEIAGPGFINIKLSDESLINNVSKRSISLLKGKKILVEYSDPNPFKPLHAGHLYTTLVGDVIARLVELAGADTVRLNFGGDVGLHVAKCMWAVNQEVGDDISKIESMPEQDIAIWMGQKYVQGNDAYENDENSKTEIIELNKKIYAIHENEDKDSVIAQIYWSLRSSSYDYFKSLYKELQVHEFDRFIPESEVTRLGLDTVQAQLQSGVYVKSDGAVIFDGEKYGLHKRVFINSEGLPTYEAKDVGLNLTKWQDYKFDKSIIITADEIKQYMQVVLKSIEQFAPEPAKKTEHITHGMVKLRGNEKMSSRKGNIVTAFDILDSARKAGEESRQASTEEVVLASVKYAMVKNRIGGDIVYDPNESIALEGNSGPYLQYTHARACSILNKSSDQPSNIDIKELLQDDERSLVRKLAEYQQVLSKAIDDLAPHIVCSYLYELAQKFNHFYEKNKVIGDERQNLRINIVSEYTKTLKHGLNLLGIEAPESM